MKKQQKRLFIPLFLLFVFMIVLTGCNTDDSSEPAEVSGGDSETIETEESTVSDEEEPAEEIEKEDDHEMTEEETMEDPESAGQTEEGTVVTEDVASPLLKQGETAVFTFQDEGVYNIHCDPHPVMKMTVTVEEGAEIEGSIELDIADYEFSEDISVAPGTVITWTNQDSVRHNVAIEIGE